MDGGVGLPMAPNPTNGELANTTIDTLNTVAMTTGVLATGALAAGALAGAALSTHHMSMGAPQVPSMHSRQKSSSDMGYYGNKTYMDPRLSGYEQQQQPVNLARPSMVPINSLMHMHFPRYDSEHDRNLATSPTLHQHLIAPQSLDQNTLAAFQKEIRPRRPSLAPQQSSTTSLPPVRDLIEVANDVQLDLSRRTSSYSSMGGADLTPSRRQSSNSVQRLPSNSVPQSPMHFSSVVYPSPGGSSHRRQDSFPSLGPTDMHNSSYNPRRVPANTHRIPPFPTMLHSTSSTGGTNSSNSIPSLRSIPSLTSAGSFETSSLETPPLPPSAGAPSIPQPQKDLGGPENHSYPLYPTVPMNGHYKCTFDGCKAAPFTTQYLLTSHMNVHSSERPHYCPVKGCERGEGGKGFKRKNEMKRHGLVHSSPGYICPFCPDREHRYPRPDNLQRHVRMHHEDKSKDDPQLRMVLEQRLDGSTPGAQRGRKRRVSSVVAEQ